MIFLFPAEKLIRVISNNPKLMTLRFPNITAVYKAEYLKITYNIRRNYYFFTRRGQR